MLPEYSLEKYRARTGSSRGSCGYQAAAQTPCPGVSPSRLTASARTAPSRPVGSADYRSVHERTAAGPSPPSEFHGRWERWRCCPSGSAAGGGGHCHCRRWWETCSRRWRSGVFPSAHGVSLQACLAAALARGHSLRGGQASSAPYTRIRRHYGSTNRTPAGLDHISPKRASLVGNV